MLITTDEEYEKIPDGAILTLVPAGDAWHDKGKAYKVIKIDDELREITDNFWNFSEKDDIEYDFRDNDYSFIVIK